VGLAPGKRRGGSAKGGDRYLFMLPKERRGLPRGGYGAINFSEKREKSRTTQGKKKKGESILARGGKTICSHLKRGT